TACARAIAKVTRWHLVQEPLPRRYALHAVVRHAVARWTRPAPDRLFEHYVTLLERDPSRLVWEQTHLFGAMDYAQRKGDVARIVRVESLLGALDPETASG